jgi:hypothetical protein
LVACDPGDPASCGEAEICLAPPRHCDDPEIAICVPLPPDCSMEPWPVCGCDNVTYEDPCEMILAGVSLFHEGPCESGP